MPEINYASLVTFIEFNWETFVDYSDSEEDAERTLAALKREAGMS